MIPSKDNDLKRKIQDSPNDLRHISKRIKITPEAIMEEKMKKILDCKSIEYIKLKIRNMSDDEIINHLLFKRGTLLSTLNKPS